jgi:NNP family nitrate/nitrite transporter-like MFS transporter
MASSGGRRRPFAVTPVILLVSVLFLTFVGRLVVAPLLPAIERDLGISHAQSGTLFVFISAGFTAMMLLSGFVAERLTHRWAIVLAGCLVGLGAAGVAVSPTLLSVQLSLLLLGSGSGLYPPSGIATLTDMVRSEHWGKALAIHDLGPNSAFVLAPLVATLALTAGHWRYAFVGIAVVSFTVVAVFALRSSAGKFAGKPPNLRNVKRIIKLPAFWVIMAFFAMASAATYGVFSILPTYLVSQHGFSEELVNTVVSVSRLSGIALVFLAGWLRDHIGERLLIGIILGVTGVLTVLIGITSGSALLVIIIVQPTIVPAFFTVAVAALSGLGPPEIRNVAVSLTIPGANVFGTGLYPAAGGLLGDAGHFPIAFIGLGILMLLALPLVRWLPRAAQEEPEPAQEYV